MNIYILFYGSYYYPKGGWKDLALKWNAFGSLNLMRKRAKIAFENNPRLDWYHIVSFGLTRFPAEIIEEGSREDLGL